MICHNGLVSPVRTCPEQSEVTEIVKQRFLPELGKLLTFMAEEDRQTALTMYSRLFDDAEDEQQLMDLLVSPTRQAVVLARTYNKKEREQLLASPQGEDQTPAFVLAIDKIYQQVAPRHEVKPEEIPEPEPVQVNQFSLFPDEPHPIADSEYVPFQIEATAVPIEEPVEELPVEPVSPAREETPAEAAPAEALPAEEEAEAQPAEESPVEQEPVPAPVPAEPMSEEEPAAEGTGEEQRVPHAEESRAPEAEPAAVSLPEEQRFPRMEERRVPAEPSFPAPTQEPVPERPTVELNAADYDLENLDYIPETRRKTRVFLLILYILMAIPVTLAGIALLLIPTVLALGLALLVIVLGSAALVAAFSGFPKLANLLIVFGTAIIVLALGLLLLWLFVWFIGGAIAGLIRGIIDLGRKWCFVEVPV
jgi:uncharacterized membrane protein